MKRLLSGILICICILGMATGVHAENTIVPLWDNINRLTVNITFDGTAGKASAYVADATYSAEISGTLTVYKQKPVGCLSAVKKAHQAAEPCRSKQVSQGKAARTIRPNTA